MTGKKLTREEELLLQDFSRNVSTKSSALFYGNALVVSAIPLWLFWRIQQMEPLQSAIIWVVVTVLSTWLVAFGYKNTKFVLKHKWECTLAPATSYIILFSISDWPRNEKRQLPGRSWNSTPMTSEWARKKRTSESCGKKMKLLTTKPPPSPFFTTTPSTYSLWSASASSCLPASLRMSIMPYRSEVQLGWSLFSPLPLNRQRENASRN